MVMGMNLGKTFRPTSTLVCKTCMKGKQYAAKLGNNAESQATKVLEIVHLSVCGPMKNIYVGGPKYFVGSVCRQRLCINFSVSKSKFPNHFAFTLECFMLFLV